MDRASIYFLEEGSPNTYDFDENLPALPLPDLHDTLKRYYESLLPFGNESELENSRKVITKFENGIGKELHERLRERAGKMKNWLNEWWDIYGYHTLRMPLNPYIVMAMPVNFSVIGIEEKSETFLKNLARITYHTVEFWDLLHKAKIKPLSSNGGKVKYSSSFFKRFFSTTRVPGEEVDHIECHFKSVSEGKTPDHALVSGKGRLFIFDTIHEDGTLITPIEIYVLLQRVRSILDYEPMGDCVPILTHDNRTEWARNRQRLMEISPQNKDTLKLIESASIVLAFDENEPRTYEEVARLVTSGNFHSKWGDRTSTVVAFKNGKFGYIGEHSAYDGTYSVSYALFVQLSVMEEPEPNWADTRNAHVLQLKELKFELNEVLGNEIQRVLKDCDERRNDVIVTYEVFEDYGKDFMKLCKLHPDSYIQVVLQLAYTLLHDSVAPIYETALMRHYYNGRTETLRSCSTEVYKFIEIAKNPKSTKHEIVNAFKTAVNHHNHMMNEARKGNGIDRHLFGLWCIAHQQGIDISEFYDDPLYSKSGGGGNFVLSTSTLGYTPIVGYVAPMLVDGYGIFYSITNDTIHLQVSAYRNSTKTSAYKFSTRIFETLRLMKTLIEEVEHSKL